MEKESNCKKAIIVLIVILVVTTVIIAFFNIINSSKNSELNNSNQNSNNNEQSSSKEDGSNHMNLNKETKINLKINNRSYKATLENNQTAMEFIELLPMTINMNDHLSNEKFYDLSRELTTNSSSPGKINAGDIMLFGSNTLVLFYDSFSTPYNYTRLGKIDDILDLKLVLGNSNIEVTFEISD